MNTTQIKPMPVPRGPAAHRDAGETDGGGGGGGKWAVARKWLTWAFFAAVLGLLVSHARSVDWGQVWQTLRGYPAGTLALAGGLALLSYLIYSSFDLFGRAYTGHRLSTPTVLGVAFISYAFNLNLGALVGGVAFRFRLYSRLGLDKAAIGQVLGLSVLTNWLGYCALAGVVFALGGIEVPGNWKISSETLQLLGIVLLVAVASYLAACAFSRRRSWMVRGHELNLPSWRVGVLQVLLSGANWLTITAVVYVLLQQQLAYGVVVAVLLVGAVAGVLTHVPAGLGVLEAVFVALLGSQLSQGQLLGALVAYRALYYLAPLALAGLLYARLEARARRLQAAAGQD
ncbi:lysylphosphatidylglycerol synthase domain-containing protein [Aquabacterium sp. A7-Y]|uniref:lysylphosphatidylglycerol synthase domain-containing protein n=1 Tax=Aquabacterium sp. A7-Y TaxID=1349605 RepID=UPI00223CE812|nr:lysylphosphatidylglycerol synthase domain-containing protein [Aquabacterium sp. A7-Y]MCW7539236.1 lysylphosphatidylglycerol synthase domain-containing protein [Aquabacterium sp. A7-Y]